MQHLYSALKSCKGYGGADILGVLYQPPFTNEGQIWCAIADPRSTFIREISSECVHCLGFWWPKTTILGKF